jgi:predicted transposase/invertase (TIGR01784 family)
MDKAGGCAEEFALYLSNDMEALRAYQMRRMAQMDLTSGLNYARSEGKKKGKREAKEEIARNLKTMGMPIEQIAQVTGLSGAEIGRL